MNSFDYVKLFASPQGKELLRKALTTNMSSGGTLIAEHLETVITNEMVRLVPELAVPEYKFDPQKIHEFSKITALPAAGSAMGEGSVTPTTQSVMKRQFIELKVLKRKGSVTGFLEATAKKNYDAVNVEIENQLQSFGNDQAFYLLHGNKGANEYQFDGISKFIATNRGNETWGGAVPTDFSVLNDLKDASNRKKGGTHRRCYVMSPEMLTKYSSLYTQVRDNRSAQRDGTTTIEINGGHRLQTYTDIPILESSQTRPQGQMGAVTAAHAGSGGAIPNDTRYFQVAPVTWDGEQIASAQVTDTSSSSDTITLSWTAYEGALLYRIYAGDTTGQAVLVKVISAKTYDSAGTPTGNVTGHTFTAEPLTPDTDSVPTHMQADKPYNYSGGVAPEEIYLWDLDPYQGLGKVAYTNEGGSDLNGLATMIKLDKVDDRTDFLLKSYMALVDSFEATSGMHRGLRVS